MLDAIPGKTFTGTVSFIYPHVDHMTRTLMVRSTFDNPDFALKPGMYADANVIAEAGVGRDSRAARGGDRYRHQADRVRRGGWRSLRARGRYTWGFGAMTTDYKIV